MYPVTKVIEKSMLPIGRRPVIHYIVHECMTAGVQTIAIVVRKGNHQVREYYSPHDELNALLHHRGWAHKSEALQETLAVPEIVFIEQDLEGGDYGTGVPALLAQEFVDGDAFYFISGDDVLIDPTGVSSLAMLGAVSEGGPAIMGQPVGTDRTEDYGYLLPRATSQGLHLVDIVEKPTVPSQLRGEPFANISRYVLTGAVLDAVAQGGVDTASGEVRITDGLLTVLRSGGVVAVSPSKGRYFDIGSATGFADAWRFVVN